MQQLSPRGRQWLKTLHMLFVCGWVGGAVALLIIRFIAAPAAGQADAHGIDLAAKIVDDCLIIPSALGSLFTGLTFSLFTSWGFFRHRWLTFKWVATLGTILFGTFFLGPWVNGMEAMTAAEGGRAVGTALYQQYDKLNGIFGILQFVLLGVMLALSYLKPWGRRP